MLFRNPMHPVPLSGGFWPFIKDPKESQLVFDIFIISFRRIGPFFKDKFN